MTRKKTNTKYDTIKIPTGLTLKIDEMIEESKHDFTSRTDVIKYAVRLLYSELKRNNPYIDNLFYPKLKSKKVK